MWFDKSTLSGDEEALLLVSPGSPTSPTSTYHDFTDSLQPAKGSRIHNQIFNVLCQVPLFVIPSFLRRASPGSANSVLGKGPLASKPKHSTQYLDGVRGVASFIVFTLHYSHSQFAGVNTGYIVDGPDASVWQLPMLRLFYSGSAMVSVFFVVSGYVLTHRYVQKMYQQEFTSLYSSLTSLAFRRALRLFLPSLASCMLAFICVSVGLVNPPNRIDGRRFRHGIPALISYIDQESNPWTWELYMSGFYNPQLWSIALEYRGSMVVFLIVLGLSKTRTLVRVLVETAITAHAFGHRRWDVALFVAGMMIAEFDVFVHHSASRTAFMQRKAVKAFAIVVLIVGVWISGYPREEGPNSWGYGFLSPLWPFGGFRRRFWVSIASILIVTPMPYLPLVQAFFNSRVVRYLGKISFALYLVHGLGNRTIGTWIIHFTRMILGSDEYWVDVLNYIASMLLYIPIVIWLSDMFWRGIDIPSTNFAKWVETKCAYRPTT
jgi:peptidoglycan/LPS O-acetylase OafA/YrhL